MEYPVLDIRHYSNDGLIKLCNVRPGTNSRWLFTSINKELMYSTHRSWVYFIVVGNKIYKIGETGNPLGICKTHSDQPIGGTRCRMGRLANHQGLPDTDVFIRLSLTEAVDNNRVSIWVRKCDIVMKQIQIGNGTHKLQTAFHKDLEMKYLDYIYDYANQYPELNKGRK